MVPVKDSRAIATLRRMHQLMSKVNAGHDLQEVLQTVAEGVADVVGFQVACIRQLRSDNTLEVVAVAGDDHARETLLGDRVPVEALQREFALADEWGDLRFVPHERLEEGMDGLGWVPDLTPLDVPDAWHPLDALFAPLFTATGELSGLLSVDLPHDGRRPGRMQREVLEMYAAQAGIAINNAMQRARLVEQVRLAEATRTILHTAGRDLNLARLIEDCVAPIVQGLRTHGMWIRAFAADSRTAGGYGAVHPPQISLDAPEQVLDLAGRIATACWDQQRAVVLSSTATPPADLVSAEESALLLEFIGRINARSLLCVPMGAGRECLGYLALTRTAKAPAWSDEEIAAVLAIGRDLGRAVLHARLFERERQLVEELQNLDRYKTDLIATISHELKNPLTSVMGHLELIQPVLAETSAARSLGAISRNAARLEMMVEDLLLLSKVGDPTRPLIPVEVDLVPLLDDTVEMLRIQTERRGVALRLDHPGTPVLAWGDRGELERLVTNIVSNAIKFTPSGRTVQVTLAAHAGHVTFTCRDEGLGISEADQEFLFTEFYRSSNPEAVAVPGTGLGLTIVKRIVDRHHGSIDVRSALGEGSTFTIRIPSPARLLDTTPAEVPPTEVSAEPAAEITAETPSARVEEPVSAGA